LLNGDNRIKNSSFGSGSATLYIGNAAIQVSSDQRLKTNIVNTTMSAIDKIKQVRIVDFIGMTQAILLIITEMQEVLGQEFWHKN
jgi:hypothetical protein